MNRSGLNTLPLLTSIQLLAMENIKILKARYFCSVDIKDEIELASIFMPHGIFNMRQAPVGRLTNRLSLLDNMKL